MAREHDDAFATPRPRTGVIFLEGTLHWSISQVDAFMAPWVIGYGIVQSASPILFHGHAPGGGVAAITALILAAVAAMIPLGLMTAINAQLVIVGGLTIFGVVILRNCRYRRESRTKT